MNALPDGHGQELVSFAHSLTLSDLPVDVVARAKTCVLEAIGCGIFGSTQPWSRILLAEMTAEGAPGACSVLGTSQMLAAPAAALVNGTAIHGFELDDLIAESITHPAACVIPAALAAGEAVGASGARLVEAIVAGYEVMHRVGLALGTEPAKRGFHTTSLVAPVACAVAAGKVMQLGVDQLYSAVGLACSAASGVKSFAAGRGGGMVKRLHLGRSAEAGVRSAQLAARGFLGPPFALDSAFGLLEVFGGAGADASKLTHGLGRNWAVRDVWFKVFPICGWIQAVVVLLSEARGTRPLSIGEIKTARIGVSAYAAKNNGEPAPVDTMGAQYSIPYCAAVALLGEPRDPKSFLIDAINDPVTRALASKIEVVVDPAIEAIYPRQFGASMRLELADGTLHERAVMECHGTPADPCTEREHLDKFRWLAGSVLPASAVAELARLIDAMPALASVRDLTAPLHSAALDERQRA
ncbi:MmgE/PrpD family protein [Bradyrhizobium sp. LHD-71]|uniref:MmgE/PrpD family protein n=1 Tax=Bradyrhizobium sp. LHD-71 TaxID=3072141 RepID=UPI00280FBDB5|nr:MmgE/PrpD family protein [Bradyrhizobium sp. LHD-71]MDQ8730445.1 MmgE/PrpD family protein [Bradyrhizobium sp. LHD-71]